jgi:aspartate/glutamate racemase
MNDEHMPSPRPSCSARWYFILMRISHRHIALPTALVEGGVIFISALVMEVRLHVANTPHIAFGELSARSPIPLVSIVKATCDFAKTQGLRRLGLFGTRFTMQAGFYQEACAQVGIEVVTPEPDQQTTFTRNIRMSWSRGSFCLKPAPACWQSRKN